MAVTTLLMILGGRERVRRFIYINVIFNIDSALRHSIKLKAIGRSGEITLMKPATMQQLYADTQEMLSLQETGIVRQARQVAMLDASQYTDEAQFAAEQKGP